MENAIEKQYQQLLTDLKLRIESKEFLERHRQHEQDFTRRRS